MTDKLSVYSVWCLTDNKEVLSDYRFGPPTVCPENNSHSIDTDPTKIVILSTISSEKVTISEDNGPTQGNFRVKGVRATINPIIDSITEIDQVFPYHVGVHSLVLRPGTENLNDKVDIYSFIPVPIGALTANGAIGDTILNVSPTIFTYVNVGYEFTINDGTNSQFLGECLEYNKIAGTITISNALTLEYSAASPSYLHMRVCKASDLYFSSVESIDIGVNIAGSSIMNAGVVGRMIYTNVTGGVKTFDAHMNHIY